MPKGVYPRTGRSIDASFWDRVICATDILKPWMETPCWGWRGSISTVGFPTFRSNYQWVSAIRYAYVCHFGRIPKGLRVFHRCGTRICCNPWHLYLGTVKLKGLHD